MAIHIREAGSLSEPGSLTLAICEMHDKLIQFLNFSRQVNWAKPYMKRQFEISFCLIVALLFGNSALAWGSNVTQSQLEDIEICSKDLLEFYRPGLSDGIFVFDKRIHPDPEYKTLFNVKKYAVEYHARLALSGHFALEVRAVDNIFVQDIKTDPFSIIFKKKRFCKYILSEITVYRFIGLLNKN